MSTQVALLEPVVRFVVFAALATGGALLATALLRDHAAALRHRVCLIGLVASAALPVAWALLPGVELVVAESIVELGAVGGGVTDPAGVGLGTVLLAVWAGVMLALLARLGVRVTGLSRIVGEAREFDDQAVRRELHAAARSVGLAHTPRVLRHPAIGSPAAWALVRPVVFLPADARTWTRNRLRAVLLHECAHLARRDPQTQLLADVVCAVFWFLPTAWLAARRMRLEREIAADERVVRGGARPSGYARFLLRWSCSHASPVGAPGAVAALGGTTHLEARIRALLHPVRARRGPSADDRSLATIALVAAVVAAATLTPVRRVVSAELPARTAAAAVASPLEAASDASDALDGHRVVVAAAATTTHATLDAPLNTPLPDSATAGALETPKPGPPTRARAGFHRVLTTADAFDSDGRLLGGALVPDAEHGLVLDTARLCEFLGLPREAHVEAIVAPTVVRRVR